MVEVVKEISFLSVIIIGLVSLTGVMVHIYFWAFDLILDLFKLNSLFRDFIYERNRKTVKPRGKRR